MADTSAIGGHPIRVLRRQYYQGISNRKKDSTGLEALIEKTQRSNVRDENLHVNSSDNTPVTLSVSLARLSLDDLDSVLIMATDITTQTLAENALAQTVCKLEKAINGTVMAITKITEARDPYTAGHQARVAQIAEAVAHKLGMSEDECSSLKLAGLIHDSGIDSALREIEAGAGTRYDPDVAMAAISLFQDDGFVSVLVTPDSP